MPLTIADFIEQEEGVTVDDVPPEMRRRIDDALADLTGGPGGVGSPENPDAIVVSKNLDGRAGFTAIQDAIDGTDPQNGASESGASEGDTIFVEPGTYEERPVVDSTDGLTVRGTSSGVVIDASDDAQFSNPYGFSVQADGVTLENFRLKGPVQPAGDDAYPGSYFGLKISGSENITVEDVTVEGSSLSQIDLNSVNGAELRNVTADGANNNSEGGPTAGTGLFLTNCEDIVIDGITTRNNDWGGIAVSAWESGSYPRPNPAARDIQLTGTNTIEDSPVLYTEEQPKESPFHLRRDERVDTDGDEQWDVSFPLNGTVGESSVPAHDVTGATIGTGNGRSGQLSHTLIYDRASPAQVAELYFVSAEQRDAAVAEVDAREGYDVIAVSDNISESSDLVPPGGPIEEPSREPR